MRRKLLTVNFCGSEEDDEETEEESTESEAESVSCLTFKMSLGPTINVTKRPIQAM